MRYVRYFALVVMLSFAGSAPLFAATGSFAGANVAVVAGIHAQVVVAAPGIAVGWHAGRYWDGHRYWDHDSWYAAQPGWRGGWGPGWHNLLEAWWDLLALRLAGTPVATGMDIAFGITTAGMQPILAGEADGGPVGTIAAIAANTGRRNQTPVQSLKTKLKTGQL